MREFYVYGFKSRDGYSTKSARSYDDERRRLESWLGDHMSFVRTPEGKSIFISIDSRTIRHNPLYNAWKAKSFTDGDVTLHFILFDILHDPSVRKTISELLLEIDETYLSGFESPMMFDESTVRKKLKEYCEAGIIAAEKEGRKVYYRRTESTDVTDLDDVLHFFSEAAPCGVIGSFILDKEEADTDAFTFKHHYITSAIDSGVLAALFTAMREKRAVELSNLSRRRDLPRRNRVIPLRIFISVQTGRQHLVAYYPEYNIFQSYRVDYLSNIKLEEVTPRFDELRAALDGMQSKMWGVSVKRNKWGNEHLEHVEFTIKIEDGEDFIVRRLEREKRVGTVEKIDEHTYRFVADVYDTSEMVPWIRTFICRIVQMNFSNRTIENQFKRDLESMYRIYGIGEEAAE
ncbi:MAG: WYL domain-containing protein [Ruminococcaceae bacterium]|nr:WYL domain-containing protein [Oscillospiraceae bacterium]